MEADFLLPASPSMPPALILNGFLFGWKHGGKNRRNATNIARGVFNDPICSDLPILLPVLPPKRFSQRHQRHSQNIPASILPPFSFHLLPGINREIRSGEPQTSAFSAKFVSKYSPSKPLKNAGKSTRTRATPKMKPNTMGPNPTGKRD